MHASIASLMAGIALGASPALAAQQDKAAPTKTEEPDKPIADREVTATDVAATPLDDLNLRKQDVPALLITAQQRPYDLSGLRGCSQIAAAVGELDAVLGDDIDLPPADKDGMSATRVAREAVRVFIPFNGLIREISGANNRDRQLQSAVFAGTARRSFLKGVGQARGCRYPARAVTQEVIVARLNAADAKPVKQPKRGKASPGEVTFASTPVVQKTD